MTCRATCSSLRILEPADALQDVAESIDQWIADLADDETIRSLVDVLRHIVGNDGGSAANGALSRLEAENLNAAMVQLREAIVGLSVGQVRDATGEKRMPEFRTRGGGGTRGSHPGSARRRVFTLPDQLA